MKITPDFQTFEQRCRQGNLIPVWAEVLADMETPVSAFRKLTNGDENAFLLESVEQGEQLGRYSFMGSRPDTIIRARDGHVELVRNGKVEPIDEFDNPMDFMRDYMRQFQPSADHRLPPFIGGAVGYMAYDIVRHFEDLPNSNPDELDLPDCYFIINDSLAIFDHVRHRMVLLANAHVRENPRLAYETAISKIERMAERLRTGVIAPPAEKRPPKKDCPNCPPKTGDIESNFTREEFEQRVERIKEYICAGDAFQVVFSQRFSKEYKGDPFDIYRALRGVNPSPYMFYLKFGDLQLAGSSPEILVRVTDGEVVIRPIAGTRPRGETPEQDKELEADLLADPKERAEHLMLIDLGRNDAGRVSAPGTVRVDDLMIIERYSHVMHIVSNVRGKLEPGKDAFDALAASFPAGTLSGAPKIRAMEIIDETENLRRGPYGGAIGYFSYDGNLDTCITIRTAIIHGGRAYVQAGAGIVADSVPANEFIETQNKACGMLRAVELAEQGLQ